MEDSSALPDEPASSQPTRSAASPAVVISSSTNSQPSPRHDDAPNQQSRRLQLRNAGFRGAFLPIRRISPIFRSRSYSESLAAPTSNENAELSPERRTLYGEDMPPSPVNILQEIHNSTRRSKKSPRPGLGNIFQDSTATESTSSLSGRSWYNENTNSSPIGSPINMAKLGERSLNQRTPPPLTSPLAKQIKGRNGNRPNPRSTSFEASKYIEHLESQLTVLNAKMDTLVSPNTNKARATKLRALTVEVRSLRHELADWEKNFADRVEEGIERGLEVEAGLRGRAQAAEDDAQIKDMRVKELEFENETLRLKLKDTESLEITNANLEKRVDVLTSLLVQSPTKLEFGSAASSPSKREPLKRTPRPRSMLSPVGGVRLSLSTIGESTFWGSKALGSDSSISESPEQPGKYGDEDSPQSPDSMIGSQHAGIFDEDSGTSSSQRSVPSASSRPTSLLSSCSLGTLSVGLPIATNRDDQAKIPHRRRRMRRFPSGSGNLKPLILPSAAGTPSLPASAPVYQASDVFQRDISNFSLDPTTAFLSQQELSSTVQTPTQPQRARSNTWAQNDALRALEGRSSYSDVTTNDEVPLQTPPPTVEECFSKAIRESSEEQEQKASRPKSLEEELRKAFLETSDTSFAASFNEGLMLADEESHYVRNVTAGNEPYRGAIESDSILIGIDERPASPSPAKLHLRQRFISPSSEITPKPTRLPALISSPSKSPPSTAVVPCNASGLCARLTNMITRTRQSPTILAQRLLYNAWALGSARLGGIGWWLLGVLFGPRSGNRKRKTDGLAGEVPSSSRFDWRPYTADASRRRTAHCYLNYGSSGGGKATTPVETEQDLDVEPHVFPCDDCEEPSLKRTFRLWFQFSLTIVLAVGVAIKYGPGTLLEPQPPPPSPPAQHFRRGLPNFPATKSKQQDGHGPANQRSVVKPHHLKPLTFAQMLGPADFEGRIPAPATDHHRPS